MVSNINSLIIIPKVSARWKWGTADILWHIRSCLVLILMLQRTIFILMPHEYWNSYSVCGLQASVFNNKHCYIKLTRALRSYKRVRELGRMKKLSLAARNYLWNFIVGAARKFYNILIMSGRFFSRPTLSRFSSSFHSRPASPSVPPAILNFSFAVNKTYVFRTGTATPAAAAHYGIHVKIAPRQ